MSNDEKKFEQYVDSIRFDDEPREGHREQLEQELFDAYDNRDRYADSDEPTSVYFRKLAIAAGFLIVVGALFWTIDSAFISRDPFAYHPDKEVIRQILEEENVTGTEKQQLIAKIRTAWTMICNQDANGLTTIVKSPNTAAAVRKWAAGYLARFGDKDSLLKLEETIEKLGITDPNDPRVIAAESIRQRLGLPKPEKTPPPKTGNGQTLQGVDWQPETD